MSLLAQELGDKESGRHLYIIILVLLFWTILAHRDQPGDIDSLLKFVYSYTLLDCVLLLPVSHCTHMWESLKTTAGFSRAMVRIESCFNCSYLSVISAIIGSTSIGNL